MKIRLLHILTLSVALCSIVPLRAAAEERTDSLLLKVYFRQDISRLELDYRGNAQMLERFTGEVNRMVNDSSYHIQDIRIRSGASPEGGFLHNRDLSWNRGRVLKDYLQAALLLPDNKFCIEAVGEDWQALREKVERNSVPDKEKILSILDKYSSWINGHPTSTVGSPKKELMDLNGGRTWFWLLDNIYPDLRSAGNTVVCRYTHAEAPAAPVVGHVIDTVVIVQKYVPEIDTTGAAAFRAFSAGMGYPGVYAAAPYAGAKARVKRERKGPVYRFAIRTNLLFDVAIAPNIGVEFPIGKRVSVLANHVFPWHTWNSDRYAYQILNTSAEARWWFGDRTKRSVLTGGYVGVYGAFGKGDLEYSSKGYQVQSAWHAGITGGWSIALGKRDNWRLDLGLGIGYLPLDYDYYERSERSGKLIYQSSGHRDWIGPTNLRCSLLWMLPMNKKAKTSAAETPKTKQGKKNK